MIKDKISPQLKARFRKEIQKTVGDGNERGFLICIDEKGKLSPTNTYIGEESTVILESLELQCPYKIQGDFHTHASVNNAMKILKKDGIRVPPFSVVRDMLVKEIEESKSEIGPSHGDVLNALARKYKYNDAGTVCIGSDAKPKEINCWSIKDGITKNGITQEDFARADKELKSPAINDAPHEWVKKFFDKELIKL